MDTFVRIVRLLVPGMNAKEELRQEKLALSIGKGPNCAPFRLFTAETDCFADDALQNFITDRSDTNHQ